MKTLVKSVTSKLAIVALGLFALAAPARAGQLVPNGLRTSNGLCPPNGSCASAGATSFVGIWTASGINPSQSLATALAGRK